MKIAVPPLVLFLAVQVQAHTVTSTVSSVSVNGTASATVVSTLTSTHIHGAPASTGSSGDANLTAATTSAEGLANHDVDMLGLNYVAGAVAAVMMLSLV